jgi:hypothetical protein
MATALFVLSSFFALSELAFAQSITADQRSAFLFDVAPNLEMPNSSEATGILGISLGLERQASSFWHNIFEFSLNGKSDVQREGAIFEKHVSAASFLTGMRFYLNGTGEGWFCDGKAGIEQAKSETKFADDESSQTTIGLPVVFEGGYRMTLKERLSLRLGAKAGYTTQIATSQTSGKGEPTRHPHLARAITAGFGYHF